jgi:hypothetical protein
MTQIYELVTKQDVGVSYSPFVIYTELFLLHKVYTSLFISIAC